MNLVAVDSDHLSVTLPDFSPDFTPQGHKDTKGRKCWQVQAVLTIDANKLKVRQEE